MRITRLNWARLCLVIAVISLLLPWEAGGAKTSNGLAVNDGQVTFLALLITLVLIQVKFRPAWTGAGFVVAVSGRAILNLSDTGPPDVGVGPVIVALAALAAAALMLRDLFAAVSASAPSEDEH
ncbi:MAG: hypothetical protein OXF75_11485 [Acidimicrobiaceae bacterium]|nr:hypothetical protein [Acidimicrobiaceae bacterium]